MDSLRQTIIDAVLTRLRAVPTLSGRVVEWAARAVPETTLPLVIVRDSRVQVNVVEMGHRHTMDVEIEVLAASAAAVRGMLADIINAVGLDPQWSQNALMTIWLGDELMVDHGTGTVAGAKAVMQIVYRTREWAPATKL